MIISCKIKWHKNLFLPFPPNLGGHNIVGPDGNPSHLINIFLPPLNQTSEMASRPS